MTRWTSNAQWPESVNTGRTDHVSTDDHGTREMAEAVCDALMREGLGGERKIFPVKTWVEKQP